MIEEFKDSEVCQKCARCCKCWWFYTNLKDDCLRATWLDTDKVTVKKIKEGLWKIVFHIPCKMLIEKDGKYYCKQYDKQRPEFCKNYPMNFKDEPKEVIDEEFKVCPIIKKVIQ